MQYDTKNVCARVREAIEKSGKTTRELGKELSVSGSAVSEWMRGTTVPNNERIMQIASATGADPLYLAFGVHLNDISSATQSSELPSMPVLDSEGMTLVPEIEYGESVDDKRVVHEWRVKAEVLERHLSVSLRHAALVQVRDPSYKGFQEGDYAVIDRSVTEVIRPGVYLFFRPFAPFIRYAIMLRKTPRTITLSRGAGIPSKTHRAREGANDGLIVLGRVVGSFSKASPIATDVDIDDEG